MYAHALNLEGMEVLGQLKVTGNPGYMVLRIWRDMPDECVAMDIRRGHQGSF